MTQKALRLYEKIYQFEVSIFDTEQEKNIESYDEYIEVVFPKNSVTSVGIKIEKEYVYIETLHSYLNENKFIYTSQSFKYKE